ncbi:response regulator [Microvirga massiliensis]|uniref:response regulator n=1 Tax=Microvirga massiliensis TaxID=1033741 RepID=UPI00062B42AC|nr:response regulator [Microvirga massiliensis]
MHSSGSQSRVPVLLVEEELFEREDIGRYLAEAGFEVVDVADSDAALKTLESRSGIRAVVTDAHVPGQIDGFSFARLVRERWPDLAVIMMSGHSDASSGPIPDGGEFIPKAYLLEHLAPTLHRMLQGTR